MAIITPAGSPWEGNVARFPGLISAGQKLFVMAIERRATDVLPPETLAVPL